MGWNINIKTDKPLTREVVKEIIPTLPDSLKRGCGEQEWGWSLAVDVRLRGANEVGLSGSYGASGYIAELAADCFASRLKAAGYGAEVGPIH